MHMKMNAIVAAVVLCIAVLASSIPQAKAFMMRPPHFMGGKWPGMDPFAHSWPRQHLKPHAFADPFASDRSCEAWPHQAKCRHQHMRQADRFQSPHHAQRNVQPQHQHQHMRPQLQRQLAERNFKVVDVGDVYELRVEAPEVHKSTVFNFDVSESGALHMVDRAMPQRFDHTFRLPDGVTKDDLRLRWDADKVTVLVPKSANQKHPAMTSNTPNTEQATSAQPVKQSDVQNEPSNTASKIYANNEAVDADTDLLIEDDYDEHDSHEDPDAATGYVDNLGIFREY